MIKIVAIMGSPHKGNSLEATQRIEKLLTAHGDVEFDYVQLKDAHLEPCKGCFVCFSKGERRCPVKDDKAMIAQKIDEADGVIFVSPVYSMHVSYLMKLFIDRFACTFHRPRYMGKYALTVAVAGNIGHKDTLKYLSSVAYQWGFDVVGELGYRMAPKNTGMPTVTPKHDPTEETVAEFYAAIKAQRPKRLSLKDCIVFRIMQASYAQFETLSPTDYQYWKDKGWLESDTAFFHDNVQVGFVQDRIGRIIGRFTGWQMTRGLAQVT